MSYRAFALTFVFTTQFNTYIFASRRTPLYECHKTFKKLEIVLLIKILLKASLKIALSLIMRTPNGKRIIFRSSFFFLP